MSIGVSKNSNLGRRSFCGFVPSSKVTKKKKKRKKKSERAAKPRVGLCLILQSVVIDIAAKFCK